MGRVKHLGRVFFCGIVWTVVIAASPAVVHAADLQVLSVSPAAHSLTAPIASSIVVRFDKPVVPASIVPLRSFWAFGRWSGTVTGSFAFSDGDQTVTLTPDNPFSSGETVMVMLSHDIAATDGTTLRPGGFSFQFWTGVAPTTMDFVKIGELSTLGTDARSRAYGGIATDLNRDRFLDITIINEDTADLRVFLNRADGTGGFDDFLRPTFPVGPRASPSEPSDFNRDGMVDICVANINANSVSILLGNGDGTFAPQQAVSVGVGPRGIAVLDVDGDGDIDIVNTNSGGDSGLSANNLSLLLNDGTGFFTEQPRFEGGAAQEWALAAGDMNDDGLLDLVVGARNGRRIIVHLAVGDGTFVATTPRDSGGRTWMLVLGDVNGDGVEDVAAVNAFEGTGAILLGNGDGTVAAATLYPTDPFPLATDLGDMDGDGDLDWITSSFSGDWFLFTNLGQGNFLFDREFLAPPGTGAASCALMFDFDNDHDLDLGLIDEITDVVLLMENRGAIPVPAVSSWGLAILATLLVFFAGRIVRTRRMRCPVALNGDTSSTSSTDGATAE